MTALPPPGQDVRQNPKLWPSARDSLYGLEHDILMTRLDTMCALIQVRYEDQTCLKEEITHLKEEVTSLKRVVDGLNEKVSNLQNNLKRKREPDEVDSRPQPRLLLPKPVAEPHLQSENGVLSTLPELPSLPEKSTEIQPEAFSTFCEQQETAEGQLQQGTNQQGTASPASFHTPLQTAPGLRSDFQLQLPTQQQGIARPVRDYDLKSNPLYGASWTHQTQWRDDTAENLVQMVNHAMRQPPDSWHGIQDPGRFLQDSVGWLLRQRKTIVTMVIQKEGARRNVERIIEDSKEWISFMSQTWTALRTAEFRTDDLILLYMKLLKCKAAPVFGVSTEHKEGNGAIIGVQATYQYSPSG